MKITIFEIENSLPGLNNRWYTAEEKVSELKRITIESIQDKIYRVRDLKNVLG